MHNSRQFHAPLKANRGTVTQYLQAEIYKNLIQYNVHTIEINSSSS
jgi:hypothetical protein